MKEGGKSLRWTLLSTGWRTQKVKGTGRWLSNTQRVIGGQTVEMELFPWEGSVLQARLSIKNLETLKRDEERNKLIAEAELHYWYQTK